MFSEVRMFLQKEPDVLAKYLSIETSCNESLKLSGNHLVYTRKYGNDVFKPM